MDLTIKLSNIKKEDYADLVSDLKADIDSLQREDDIKAEFDIEKIPEPLPEIVIIDTYADFVVKDLCDKAQSIGMHAGAVAFLAHAGYIQIQCEVEAASGTIISAVVSGPYKEKLDESHS